MFFITTLYMQQVIGYSALEAGLAYLPLALTVIVSSTIAARLVTVCGVRLVLTVGLTIAAGGFALLARAPVRGSYWPDILPAFLLAAVGLGFSFVPVSIAAFAGVGERDAGLASGLINTSQQVGGALGVAVLSAVAATASKHLLESNAPLSDAITHGFNQAYRVDVIFALTALLLSIVLIRVPRSEQSTELESVRQPSPP